MPQNPSDSFLAQVRPSDTFARRHLGPRTSDLPDMLARVGVDRLEELADATVPASIRAKEALVLDGLPEAPLGEAELLSALREIASENRVHRSYLGQGYHGTIVPGVVARNVLENPGWYTQYTPYQAEISQGRLEALLNFQTMVSDLTGLDLANASLLDEATAAAEALGLCRAVAKGDKKNAIFAADDCHPQTLGVLRTRAEGLGMDVFPAPVKDHHQPRVGLIDASRAPGIAGGIVVLRHRERPPVSGLTMQDRPQRQAL